LRLGEEDRTLRESIRLSARRDEFSVRTLNAATIDDIRRALLDDRYTIVHISGHGTTSGLVLENADGSLAVPDTASLAELFRRRGVSTVLLSACYSLSAGRMVALGADYTIAMEDAIQDVGAIEFTRGFYDALGAGLAVNDAFDEGLSCARLKDAPISAVLLRGGEERSLAPAPSEVGAAPVGERQSAGLPADQRRLLLGVALDISGSMSESIANRDRGAITRLEGARRALAGLAGTYRSVDAAKQADDTSCVFAYAFGARTSDQVIDLIAILQAADTIDFDREIAERRRRAEQRAHQQYQGMGALADLARRYGFGGVVDSIEHQARENARAEIVGGLAELLLRKADSLGPATLSLSQLAERLGANGRRARLEDLEPLLFGATPFRAALERIRRRFESAPILGSRREHRVLLVISDGEPTDGDPLPLLDAIREGGVTVVSCFVTNQDIADPRVLYAHAVSGWPAGAKLLYDGASKLDESGEFAAYLLRQGWRTERDSRLFVQVNHSEVLQEFVQALGELARAGSGKALPLGR
jgi:hypothetical protein